jgi:hypothetical protein
MTTELQNQLLQVATDASKAIDEATDILQHGEHEGEPVSRLSETEIEEVFNLLRGVMAPLEEAIRASTPRQKVSLVLGQVVMTPGAQEALSPLAASPLPGPPPVGRLGLCLPRRCRGQLRGCPRGKPRPFGLPHQSRPALQGLR